ncbi:MAG: hypothetical protein K0R50_4255 [Eubacterium sp.]|jgi:hypothetical protein|nr:hypothetical protein [Eubacterium sp.]
MGAKFCNLNVYGKRMEQVQEISKKYEYYLLSPSWTTVTSDYFQWGDTQGHAKKLSEELVRRCCQRSVLTMIMWNLRYMKTENF